MRTDRPIAIFMPGAMQDRSGKMGFGVLRYSPNPIACVIDPDFAGLDAKDVTGIPRSAPVVATVAEAKALGAEVFLLGIAPQGGNIPAEWYPVIDEAWGLGLSIANGLHEQLNLRYKPTDPSHWVWDIRQEPAGLGTNHGRAADLKAKRVLMIGTDMAIGKMTAGLELWKHAKDQGVKSEFVATGQIGITILGSGVPLDAVRVDYAGGAIEREMLRYPEAELIIVEGQGSLLHPGSTATLPLLRGSMPTHLILCHKAGMTHVDRYDHIAIPPLREFCKMYEDLAGSWGNFPRPVTCGIALNTASLSEDEAKAVMAVMESETGLPVCDPVRTVPQKLLQAIVGS
jgi:uncharacterized NAD-dependent epimerase/dehydratase family protein